MNPPPLPPPPLPPPLPLPSEHLPARIPQRPRSALALGALWLAAVLYVVSLNLPALLFAAHEPVSGGSLLAIGWMGFMGGQFAWFANPLWLTAAVFTGTRRYRLAAWFSLAAVLLAQHSFSARHYYFNEAESTPIAGLGTAFWVWVAALSVSAAGNLLGCLQTKNAGAQP